TAGSGISPQGRRAASALGLRPLQPYVPLCCGPSASAPCGDIPLPADYFLHRRNIDQCEFLYIWILETCDPRLCRIDSCQHVPACLNGIAADDESVLGVFRSLCRDANDKVDLVSQDQVKEVRRLLLDLADWSCLHARRVQRARCSAGGEDVVADGLEPASDLHCLRLVLVADCHDHI